MPRARGRIRALLLSVLVVGCIPWVVGAEAGSAAAPLLQASANVAVVPGFAPVPYPGFWGMPPFPRSASDLHSYTFTEVPTSAVTTAALSQYDTVVLYGTRWSDLPAGVQSALNAFARTGKLLIWDSDGTGAQNYDTFLHPFSTSASGENGTANGSVVSFPAGRNVLASPNPSSPYYLDPGSLVADKNLINDMSAVKTGTPNWVPALAAANKSIPNGGWPLAWTYGVIGDHTGLVVYSGIDADAFAASTSPNYAVKALAFQLAAPFARTPDPSCAPRCALTGVEGGRSGSTKGARTYALCSFASPPPPSWVHGRLGLTLATSIAAGISARAVTAGGRTVGSGTTLEPGRIRLFVDTRLLPSGRSSRLRVVVSVKGGDACRLGLPLKVDNVPPKLLALATARASGHNLVTLRVDELTWMSFSGPGLTRPRQLIAPGRPIQVLLPSTVHRAQLVLDDRAGNRTVRSLHWP